MLSLRGDPEMTHLLAHKGRGTVPVRISWKIFITSNSKTIFFLSFHATKTLDWDLLYWEDIHEVGKRP